MTKLERLENKVRSLNKAYELAYDKLEQERLHIAVKQTPYRVGMVVAYRCPESHKLVYYKIDRINARRDKNNQVVPCFLVKRCTRYGYRRVCNARMETLEWAKHIERIVEQ